MKFACLSLCLLLSALSTAPATAQTPIPEARQITVDLKVVKGQLSRTYRDCVGAGRVGEGLRADWQRQLKMCRDDLGFESLRCHGLLHDELGVYREDKQGKPSYNFEYIDLVYDYLLSIGVRPFVEIGFMPNDLATIRTEEAGPDGMTAAPVSADGGPYANKKRRVTVFWWKSNVTPPKSYPKWDALITALTKHWTERYGADEVRKWRFEIWNEPNHPAFFSPNDPAKHRDEYFELYAHTVGAIKGIDAKYRVGGTAGAGPAWIGDFIDYGVKNHVPIDFISYHSYGLGGGPSGLDEFGNGFQYLNRNLHASASIANSQRGTIDKSALPKLPICITEWSASYSDHDPVHDSYFEAPYILEQLKHTESLETMSYWTFTDIFEENGPPLRPFYGGFGLVNVQGIKKPAYFAYQFLNRLGSEELVNSDPRSWVCRDDKGGVQALVYNLTDPRDASDKAPDQVVFRKLLTPVETGNTALGLHLKSMRPGRYHLSIYRVGYEKNDAYTAYLKMGAPGQIDRSQTESLKQVASGRPDSDQDIQIDSSGNFNLPLTLHTNDVVLATLTPL